MWGVTKVQTCSFSHQQIILIVSEKETIFFPTLKVGGLLNNEANLKPMTELAFLLFLLLKEEDILEDTSLLFKTSYANLQSYPITLAWKFITQKSLSAHFA